MPKKTLSVAEKFYIDSHPNSEVAALASTLNTTVSVVSKYRESLAKPPKETKFAKRDGIVCMTQAQSEEDDKLAQKVNKDFFKEHENSIFIPDPKKPVH